LRQNLQQVAPNQEKPHTTPFHYLIYSIYISVVFPDCGPLAEDSATKLKRDQGCVLCTYVYCVWSPSD
jgi:hypothetical protein